MRKRNWKSSFSWLRCGMLCGVVCYLVWYVMWCGILFVCMLCGVVCYLVWYHWQWWTNYSCEGDVTVSPAQDPGVCLLSGPASTPTSQPASFLIFNLNKRERIWQRSSSSGQIVSNPVRTTLHHYCSTTFKLWHHLTLASVIVIHHRLVKKVTLSTTTETKTNPIRGDKEPRGGINQWANKNWKLKSVTLLIQSSVISITPLLQPGSLQSQ